VIWKSSGAQDSIQVPFWMDRWCVHPSHVNMGKQGRPSANPSSNGLVSDLLVEAGRLSWPRPAWPGERIKPLLAAATTREVLRMLADPRLRLSAPNIEALLTEPLSWCEIRAGSLDVCPQRVGVPRDQVALDLAVSAKAAERVRDDASGKTSSTLC
jgi:hypothetical protein